MRLVDIVTYDELDYLLENVIFTEEEKTIIEFSVKGYSRTHIMMKLHISDRTLARRISEIKRKVEIMNFEKIPVEHKMLLTVDEMSAYSNIGQNTLRRLIETPNCTFTLKVGNKTLINRRKFEEWIDKQTVL